MSRGWNSRLGFSLRTESNSKYTVISAIYSESVAAKDGRLRVGDRIVMVSVNGKKSLNKLRNGNCTQLYETANSNASKRVLIQCLQ